MGSFNFSRLTFGMKIIYGIAAAVAIAIVVTIIVVTGNMKSATAVKIQSVKGNVRIEMANGKTKPAKKGQRFQSGDSITTGADGIVSIALDDTKTVTLNNNSKAEFKKENNQYGVNLEKGGVFFEVTEPLTSEESFDIKTTMLTAGIKGTSGYIYYNEDGNDTITVTDGKVILTAVNPNTSERSYGEVTGGQRYVVFSVEKNGLEVLSHETTNLSENDLEDFVIKMITQTDRLLTKVCEYTGWDKQTVKELYNLATYGNIEGSSEETEATVDTAESETEPVESETEATTEATKGEESTTKPAATNTPKPKNDKDKDKDNKATNTPKPTNTPTPKATATPTNTPTNTPTTTPTTTPSNTPAETTPAAEPTATPTQTPAPTATNTPVPPTNTPKPTETQSPASGNNGDE